MNAKGRKALLLCGLFLAVLAAGYANYLITTGSAGGAAEMSAEAGGEAEDVFATFKEERKTSRAQEMSYIDSVVTSTETDETTRATAQKQRLSLIETMDTELSAEGLIKTKLGCQAVVSIGEDNVNVVVDKKELSDDEVTQIAEIVKSETGKDSPNFQVMPKV